MFTSQTAGGRVLRAPRDERHVVQVVRDYLRGLFALATGIGPIDAERAYARQRTDSAIERDRIRTVALHPEW